jgi:hypothetical protein
MRPAKHVAVIEQVVVVAQIHPHQPQLPILPATSADMRQRRCGADTLVRVKANSCKIVC